MARSPNYGLQSQLAQTGWSHAGLAKRVNQACMSRGLSRAYTATSVANWLRGMMPSAPVPEILCELFAERLGIAVVPRDLGLPEHASADLGGLEWQPSPASALEVVARLWRADLHGNSWLLRSGWLDSAFLQPVREWLVDWPGESTAHTGSRQVGTTDVEVVRSMCEAFADADHRLGGGYGRSTLLHYVDELVMPLLRGTYDEQTGRALLAATARLCDLGAFMAFDSGAQGHAQRYYVQALRLAQAGCNRVLGAHILADMSMQATYVGNSVEACSLARAGQRTAKEAGSFGELARCCAMEARAHARTRDERACAQSMNQAEKALEQVRPNTEPTWLNFFTLEQLHAEFTYAGLDSGNRKTVERFASAVTDTAATGMERRHVLVSTTAATAHLVCGQSPDVEQACSVLTATVPHLPLLTSKRALDSLGRVRIMLRPYRDQACVQDVETKLDAALSPAA